MFVAKYKCTEEDLKITNTNTLTMDDLYQVTGGNCREIADDSRFLNRLNHSTDRWGAWKCWCNSSIKGKVHNAWLKLGIDTKLDACATGKAGGRNKYYLNGVEITQAQARQHAMEVTGHYMTNSEWK